MFFSQDWRERVKAENPDASFGMSLPLLLLLLGSGADCVYPRVGEIGKLLGTKWKELADEEKKVCFYAGMRVHAL
jgi:hypothetical protein